MAVDDRSKRLSPGSGIRQLEARGIGSIEILDISVTMNSRREKED